MMDTNRWVDTLPKIDTTLNHKKYDVDSNRWVQTLPKKNKDNSITKYSLTTILFIIGLVLVSIIKNETKDLQKEINNLHASIYVLEYNLNEATLEHEVITSPENISKLAKENLESDFDYYKKNQIKKFGEKEKTLVKLEEDKYFKRKDKKFSKGVQLIIARKVEDSKTKLQKIQQLYSQPKKLPEEIKSKVTSIGIKDVTKWAGFQLVKVFLGIPAFPGR